MTKYFCDYYVAKKYAEKRKLIECEYGDTGYMVGDEPISYCAWNKSGDRDDDWKVEAWYTWKRGENGRFHPIAMDKSRFKALLGIDLG